MKFHLFYLSPAALLATVVSPGGEPESNASPRPVNAKVAAKKVDRLVELDIKRAKLSPNKNADDATFLRRLYLGAVGRIPTVVETRKFLTSQDPNKRAALIDELLESPGHASHMLNYWADLFRVKTRLNNQVSGEPFIHFLKAAADENMPYDEFVREMVTASGPAHVRGNGATGLLLRDRGMQLDSMANTVRVFLGTRLECAQCHDHPFDKWKQKDFFEMAAFTGGLNYRVNLAQRNVGAGIRDMYQELRRKNDRNGMRALGRMMRQANTGITGSGTGTIRLPKDYKYEDAKPRELVKAHVLFGKDPKIAYPESRVRRGSSSRRNRGRNKNRNKNRNRNRNQAGPELNTRQSFAEWMTSRTNPRFTKVIANRMWKLAMGRGLIEPVDNMMDDTKPSNIALMRELEKLMVSVDYDLKQFLRVMFNTKTFQREATREEVPSDQKYYFQGPILRRMTGEQVWDSMLTMTLEDLDGTIREPAARASRVYDSYDKLVNMSADELRQRVQKEKLRYTDPKRYREMIATERRKQQRQRQMAARNRQQKAQAAAKRRRDKARPLYRAYARARRAKDAAKMKEIEGQLLALGIDIHRKPTRRAPRGRNRGRVGALVRASELSHPAPAGHFLRKFGQSDREQIQASHTEANVPQVLGLLNGFVEDYVLGNSSSALMTKVLAESSDRNKVRTAFLGVLNREPRGRELAVWEHEFGQHGREAAKDLVWTLVNSHEFRFIQ